MNTPLLIAHRGESHDAPENTLAAFALAWERGCRAIELDVRLTADDQVAVIHDPDTRRVAGESLVVRESTHARLARCDVGAHKAETYRGERIPLLPQALAGVPSTGRVLVEIKTGPEILPPLARAVSASGLGKEQIELICFDASVLREAGALLPGCRRLLLASLPRGETGRLEPLIRLCGRENLDGLDLCFEDAPPPASIRAIQRQGLLAYTWTVDDPVLARAHAAAGVDAITTNRAAWLAARIQPSGDA